MENIKKFEEFIDDQSAIEKQIELIAEKFVKMYPVGVTILIPSGNKLNRHIAEVIMSKSKDSHLIEGVISKLTVEEVDEIVLKKDSKFRSFYGDDFDDAYSRLELFFDDMDSECGGMFSRHFVKDHVMRNVLTDTCKVSTSRYARKSQYITDNDILIIDDTIGSGQTIKNACQVMMDSYAPKSITVLTCQNCVDTLQKYQLKTCNEVADELITSLSDYEVCVNGTKRDFNKVKQKIQNHLNERTDRVGSFNMYIDIMNIDVNSRIGNRTLWDWAKAMDKIDKDDKLEEFLLKYKKEFYKTYFKTIFASDVSKRDKASVEYEKTSITESYYMLYEMASVGYFTTFKKNGKQESSKFKVFVCGDEGEIPHMHIWDDETDGRKIHTCICLNKIEYFHHTGKEDILTSKQKKYLVDFLKGECKKNKRYKTNWEYALSMWNDNNTDKTQVDETSEVLDYTKLKD